jgi:hypothetical protein
MLRKAQKSSVMTSAEEIVPLLAPLNALRQLFARFDERGDRHMG